MVDCLIAYCEGLNDVDCGPHPVTLEAGSMTASVNISTIDDEDSECDETFTAQIILGGDGNSGRDGFRRGPTSDVEITVKDNEGNSGLLNILVITV